MADQTIPPEWAADPEFQRLDRECQLAAHAATEARRRVQEVQSERDRAVYQHRAAVANLKDWVRAKTESAGDGHAPE